MAPHVVASHAGAGGRRSYHFGRNTQIVGETSRQRGEPGWARGRYLRLRSEIGPHIALDDAPLRPRASSLQLGQRHALLLGEASRSGRDAQRTSLGNYRCRRLGGRLDRRGCGPLCGRSTVLPWLWGEERSEVLPRCAHNGNGLANGNGGVRWGENLQQHAVGLRLDLHRGLVGLDLKQRLTFTNRFPLRFPPTQNSALFNRFAKLGHNDQLCHKNRDKGLSPPRRIVSSLLRRQKTAQTDVSPVHSSFLLRCVWSILPLLKPCSNGTGSIPASTSHDSRPS